MNDAAKQTRVVDIWPQFSVWVRGEKSEAEELVAALGELPMVRECEYVDDDDATHLVKVYMRTDTPTPHEELVDMYELLRRMSEQ